MVPPRRPTAFEVSFPEEAARLAALEASRNARAIASSSSSSPLKRKATGAADGNLGHDDTSQRVQKRLQGLNGG